MVLTLADVCIGTGPRLQMLSDDEEFNSIVETEFIAWSETTRFAEQLRTLRMAKATDGEAFAAILKNPSQRYPVQLALRLIEADRIISPKPSVLREEVDGIVYDVFGNPQQYYVSSVHPGDASIWSGTFAKIPATEMIHWYRVDRPGQSRGLSEILPALPLFAQLRRFTLAVLAAAETAADFAAVLYSDAPPSLNDDDDCAAPTPYDLVALERRMATVLPENWKLAQIKAEQPATTYAEFKREILSEIGRCLQVPVNIVLGDSSKHNYASGRLDHQTFFKSIRIEQSSCEQTVLFPLFDAWYRESFRIGLFGTKYKRHENASVRRIAKWFWDGLEHVDPVKEAKAAQSRISCNISNLAIECAKSGLDWEDVLKQKAREQERMTELGLIFNPISDNDTETDADDDDESNA
jgi:lambda family phage portal protein